MRLHLAKEELGHSCLHESRDLMLMLCLHSATTERRCDVYGNIIDVFNKLGQFPSTVIGDDMDILLRFVSEYMTDDARLEMCTRSCH